MQENAVGAIRSDNVLAGLFTMAVLFAASACSTVFLQNDGFRSKLAGGCQTEDACSTLVDEASERIDHCKDNTIGYVRCQDATADLDEAKALLAKVKGSSGSESVKNRASTEPSQAPAMARAKADDPTREDMLNEMNERTAAQQATEHQQQVDLQAETQSGRCTDAHAEQLRRVLDQVVGFWRDEPLQVVTHKIVVLTAAGIDLKMQIVLPGEYHVFAMQPDGRAPELAVYDADGYEVKQASEWSGYFSAGGTGVGGRSRRLQWTDPSQPMLLKAAGQGCAMIVLVQRLW
ncbi:MAG TPA: hypothetical protein VFQ61_34320 [Polyangiaceae bacterium]|nr:hypothetical protein [Polyangiaceae bacterium]